MKNLIFVLIALFSVQVYGFTGNPDSLEYTVIAPSGLSLRSSPSVKGVKLEVLPFGSSVQVKGGQYDFYQPELVDTIDSRVGYWVETEFDGKNGYLFSGYLKNGPLYVPATDINYDFRITLPGERCQAINYDSNLNWYGIHLDSETGESKIKAVNIQLEQVVLSEDDLEIAYAESGDYVTVKALEEDSFMLFFGTREPINTDDIPFQKSYFDTPDQEHWDERGKFIFPYERVQIAQSGYDQYYLMGYENISINQDPQPYEEAIQRKYGVYLTDNYGSTKMKNGDTVSLSKGLNTGHLDDFMYSTYLGPRLVWQGDINNDGFPDVIFYTPYMSECCGGSVTYHLFLSLKQKGHWDLKKASEDIIYSCFGC